MRFLLPICLTVIWTALTGCISRDFREQDWLEVSTQHFSIISNSSERDVQKLARTLERFRAMVLTVANAETPTDRKATQIFLFDDWSSYFRYTQGLQALGFTIPTLRTNYIVVSPGVLGVDQQRIIFHEYVHYLLRQQSSRYPTWFNEGFAELLSDVRVDGENLLVGNVPRDAINPYAHAWILDLQDVLGQDYDTTWPRSDVSAYYGQAWATAHYLLTAKYAGLTDRSRQLNRYLTLLNEGRSQQQAFDEAFNVSVDQLTREIQRYVKRRRLPGFAIPLRELRYANQATSRLLPDREIARLLGELTLLWGEQKASIAAEMFRVSLEIDPDDGAARAGLALSLAHQHRYGEALSEAERAVSSAPAMAEPRLDFAQILFGICEGDAHVQRTATCIELLELAKRQFTFSIARMPDSAEAHAGMGMTLARLQQDLPKAIEHLNHASDLSQWVPKLDFELGRLYLQTGQLQLARQHFNDVLRWSKSVQLRHQAQLLLNSSHMTPAPNADIDQPHRRR